MNQSLAEKCAAIMESAVAERFVSGASLLVLKDGKEILSCQAGYRDLEQKLPMELSLIHI